MIKRIFQFNIRCFKAGIFFTIALVMCFQGLVLAQQTELGGNQAPDPLSPLGREAIHLTTIGTYSAGFVLQSYGYIGVLADMFSQGVYEPDMVRSMLGETITYLNNAKEQLKAYQGQEIQISKGDQAFINGISLIIVDLISEAEALASFTETHRDDDLARFQKSRQDAWSGIKKTLGVN
jgi:hypothetical protein